MPHRIQKKVPVSYVLLMDDMVKKFDVKKRWG